MQVADDPLPLVDGTAPVAHTIPPHLHPVPKSEPDYGLVSFWLPVVTGAGAIIFSLINLIRSIKTDRRIDSSLRERDFIDAVEPSRMELLDYLGQYKLAIAAIQTVPPTEKAASREALVTCMLDTFAEYQSTFASLAMRHRDWAKEGTDPDLDSGMEAIIVDDVFCFLDSLSPDEDATADVIARCETNTRKFHDAVDTAMRTLKSYRDECCPRRKS